MLLYEIQKVYFENHKKTESFPTFRLTKYNCRSSASPKDLARACLCKRSDKAEFGEAQARVAERSRSAATIFSYLLCRAPKRLCAKGLTEA
ncbi:hypothetical protein A0128_20405 [Leptospira tipperaryensis]|uniref:Uncharacterized protein n=1 Tax=Leptospira tipperaryensis TaxID=2564040 RepID=A0A1D7V3H0_9LEPT|nr:hypothetical protein A0128_20405 [Leptospira tipperaryensis]